MGTNSILPATSLHVSKARWCKLYSERAIYVALIVAFLLVISNPASADRQQPQAEPPAQPQNGTPPETQTTTLPAQQQPPGAAPLRVMVGKSLLINTTERLKRISVTDPAIAFA
ncbi:MAG TPA: hypothetical protein VJQ54_23900, partial [Candidatus Sulfotelmatobacter sp.]|nr:hypothetical protein [Candidatus Sulfotelmatobacter sp.]